MKNRIKRSMAYLLCVILLSLSITACGKAGSGSVSGNGIKILMTLHADDDSFLNTLADSIVAKGQELGATIDVVYSQKDTETQMQQIANAASEGYDAIICRLCDTSTTLQMENAAGNLPIVFINNEPESDYLKSDKYVYVGSYEQDAGEFQADYIWSGLGKPPALNVIIMVGEKMHAAAPKRTNAVKYFFLDNKVDVNYVWVDNGDWVEDVTYDKLNIFKKTGQSFDCIICNNDTMAMGAIKWMKENGYDTHKILVAGIDATDEGCEAVRSGDLYMTVLQDTAGQGAAAVQSAVSLAKNGSVSSVSGVSADHKYIWVPFVPITPQNVDQYK
ncbi:substrate-binding domain-containing protein [Butyrivibrio sp. M55]|uniref:substrate-binding domain-containing protein n=1 Tax=Butyrivibrio sp. M55 TaxID=1855323 RepID=UPI0008E8C7F9|nr:substrate-binding domain-containing protein [Butyrivibrio sp. M55]SFU43470.1 inositol transport system substrate-binding protein [Butyrivibrio sp. M55]